MTEATRQAVREYVLTEFLYGEDADALKDDTPLISGGILDSISTLKLAGFIEQTFGVQLDAHELSADYLDTVDMIARTVESKRTGA